MTYGKVRWIGMSLVMIDRRHGVGFVSSSNIVVFLIITDPLCHADHTLLHIIAPSLS